jgi:uncharacterized protein
MRSFELFYLLLFAGLYLIMGLGALRSLKMIINACWYPAIRLFTILIYIAVIAGFILLYIFPWHIDRASDYSVYSYFNALIFIVFFISLPLAVSTFLHYIFENKRDKVIPYIGLIISIGTGLIMIYGTISGSKNLKLKEIELQFQYLPAAFDNYKIIQISDIHFGNSLNSPNLIRKTKNMILDYDCDLLLFTGDIVNNFAWELKGTFNSFGELTTGRVCYSILGNHDYGDYSEWESDEMKQENFNRILSFQEKAGFIVLRNENVVIRNNGDSIFLAGSENWGHPPFPQYADIDAALKGIPGNAFTILMTHDPSHWDSKIKGKIDIELTLSGHTHGLQWGIQPAGIPLSLAYLTSKYWGGLYSHGEQKLYVNAGLGTIGVPWRIDMSPEITLLTLKRSEINRKK